jgi:DNA-binding NarL/FixJ family response regulator
MRVARPAVTIAGIAGTCAGGAMARPKVLLAENHAAVAGHLRAVLEGDGNFEVVAVVSDGFAVVGAAQILKPDVVVVDIAMPGLDGIAATAEILRVNPGARVVFVTVHNEAEVVRRAFEIGACGYVLKVTAGDDLVAGVNAALRGEHYASPGVFGRSD